MRTRLDRAANAALASGNRAAPLDRWRARDLENEKVKFKNARSSHNHLILCILQFSFFTYRRSKDRGDMLAVFASLNRDPTIGMPSAQPANNFTVMCAIFRNRNAHNHSHSSWKSPERCSIPQDRDPVDNFSNILAHGNYATVGERSSIKTKNGCW